MSNRSRNEPPRPRLLAPWAAEPREDAQAIAAAERALIAAEAALEAVHDTSDPAAWEARRGELEQAVAVSAQTVEAALRGAGTQDLAALELRLAALVRALAAARPPERFAAVVLEAEIVAALQVRPAGPALEGHARKELAINALFRRLGLTDSRVLATRIDKRPRGDALVAAFYALGSERRERLVATLRDATRREVRASESSRRAALADRSASVLAAWPPVKAKP
jgi:hypothetical protein